MKLILTMLLTAFAFAIHAQDSATVTPPKSIVINTDTVKRVSSVVLETYKLPSKYMHRAATFGIVSATVSVAGLACLTYGAIVKNTTATYIGAGVCGAGLVLNIPTFINLSQAANALDIKDL